MENVNKQLLDALKQMVQVAKLHRPWSASVHQAEKTIAAAEQSQQAEPVAWEYREFHDDNTAAPGWGKWKRIESEEWAGRPIKSVVADIYEFIAQGYRYEVRELYTQPPAVAVPDERAAFEAWLQENIDDTDTVRPSKEKVDAYFAVWLARATMEQPK